MEVYIHLFDFVKKYKTWKNVKISYKNETKNYTQMEI